MLVLAWICLHALMVTDAPRARDPRPNIVFILADDLGYGDLSCYGAPKNITPNLDRLARRGMRFTDFYAAQAVCSASRAAYLTGRLSNRVGVRGALGPKNKKGLETRNTLPILLKNAGYATAIYGKWHLGHLSPYLPTERGFDDYYGLPYSNDMGPLHPVKDAFPDLPLMEGTKVIAMNPDQSLLTKTYTERAVQFIEKNADRPFFLYVPQTMCHVPLFVSKERAGTTGRGLFEDVIHEIDWSVGQILDALDRHALSDNTIVIFASDNGPWLSYGNHAGSTGGLREGKGTTFEGGVRVPFIARWPGHIPAGTTSHVPVMSISLLPTLCDWLDLPKPPDLDGRSARAVLEGKSEDPPSEVLYFYWNDGLEAVRAGKWKLHLPHSYTSVITPGSDGKPGKLTEKTTPIALFDLESDRGETTNVADQNPDVVTRLKAIAEVHANMVRSADRER